MIVSDFYKIFINIIKLKLCYSTYIFMICNNILLHRYAVLFLYDIQDQIIKLVNYIYNRNSVKITIHLMLYNWTLMVFIILFLG